MAKPRRMSAAREARKRWWVLAALLIFLAVDVLLVILALQSTAPRPQQTTGAMQQSAPTTPTPEPTEDSEPASDRGPASVITAAAPTRLLSALDSETAWRATTGACPDATAEPELTTDGGESWKPTDITGSTDVRALQRILVSSADTASFIGASGDGCQPQYVRTFVAGDDFAENPELLDGSWFVTSVGSDRLHSPTGDVDGPCDSVLTVAPLDSEGAAVLCGDGSVHVTTDTGSSWSRVEDAAGTVAVTATQDGYVLAMAGVAECDGARLLRVDAEGGAGSEVGCIESPLPAAELAGSTAIDWTQDALWVWVDDRLLVSTDAGDSWT
jgi:cytoskeletal protein RodZ